MDAELIARQDELRSLLGEARVIAVVGISSKPGDPRTASPPYLQEHGYRIVPVNPHETEVLGERVYPTLLDIPEDVHVDVVDVFRRAEHTPEVARDAVAIGARLLWLQEGIVSEEAARIASEGGLDVIMGVCIKKVRQRLMAAEAENVAREAERPKRRNRPMKWEYFVAPLLEHNPGEILNNFGEDGWELVTILQQQTPAGGVSMVAYLKRQVT